MPVATRKTTTHQSESAARADKVLRRRSPCLFEAYRAPKLPLPVVHCAGPPRKVLVKRSRCVFMLSTETLTPALRCSSPLACNQVAFDDNDMSDPATEHSMSDSDSDSEGSSQEQPHRRRGGSAGAGRPPNSVRAAARGRPSKKLVDHLNDTESDRSSSNESSDSESDDEAPPKKKSAPDASAFDEFDSD